MQEKISIKENIIKYDENSLDKDISDVLKARFEDINGLDDDLSALHDPFLLKDMDKAVERLKKAKENNERVMIFGDYDVDWVTSTSILMHFFKKIGMQATYRLPHRVKDWYGLKKYFIDEAKEIGVGLVITVDCGTRDIDVIKHAKKIWVDVIVTDHHAVPLEIPEEAVAIINPKREDCQYPFKHLAWVWVAFKVMSALAKSYLDNEEYDRYIEESIDIVAIWTVADCMVLTWENRIIVKEWLKQLKKSRSRGIRALVEDKIHDDLDSDIFGFQIWPRINAAGRMDTPYKALNLILNNSDSVNHTLNQIEMLNDKRKILTKDFTEEAMWKVKKEDNLLFYISPAIEHGIIWIVAGRITEQFYKPSIVLKDEWDKMVASCRSPEYFSIIDTLEKYKDYFIGFGWHKAAAWFSIKRDRFAEFKTKILNEVNQLDFSENKKILNIDKITTFDELGFKFLSKVNIYKPYGMWNTKPLFMIQDLDYTKLSFLGNWRDHIRFDTKSWFKIFWFFMWEHYENIKKAKKVDLIFDLSEDSWQGRKNLMLKIVDLILK